MCVFDGLINNSLNFMLLVCIDVCGRPFWHTETKRIFSIVPIVINGIFV